MKKILLPLFFSIATFVYTQVPNISLEPCMHPFYHGVASGDPLSDRVIIWTRITPDSTQTGAIPVSWRVATDTAMTNIVQSGSLLTDAAVDYTVKVDVTGLQPNSYYFYDFSSNGNRSIRGRTKTATISNEDSLRFAIVSCANYEAGFFNVYRVIKERNDVDAVICLGDYIYEYESGGYSPNPNANRTWQPANEILSLSDYRTRYSVYHLDEDLRRCHQQYPFICVWDDHESANDAWMNGAENHDQLAEGAWSQRKAYAQQAYFEWLPIRVTGTNDPYQIFRNIKYGNLLELVMLDTRLHGRDLQAGTTGSTVTDVNRQLLGTDQFTWLGDRLDSAQARWKVLAQQVMMAPLKIFGVAINGDQWDGYPAERDRVFNHILQNNIKDIVVLTGDIHSSWANDLPTSTYNSGTGAGSAGVEFVTPSVTSPGLSIPGGATAAMASNGHIKYADLSQHGFVVLDVNMSRTQADWFYVNTIDQSSGVFSYGNSHYVNHLERFLRPGSAASLPRASLNYVQAPDCPQVSLSVPFYSSAKVLGFYPNPASSSLTIQFYLEEKQPLVYRIIDLSGKIVKEFTIGEVKAGLYNDQVDVSALSAGIYFFEIAGNNVRLKNKFVKN